MKIVRISFWVLPASILSSNALEFSYTLVKTWVKDGNNPGGERQAKPWTCWTRLKGRDRLQNKGITRVKEGAIGRKASVTWKVEEHPDRIGESVENGHVCHLHTDRKGEENNLCWMDRVGTKWSWRDAGLDGPQAAS